TAGPCPRLSAPMQARRCRALPVCEPRGGSAMGAAVAFSLGRTWWLLPGVDVLPGLSGRGMAGVWIRLCYPSLTCVGTALGVLHHTSGEQATLPALPAGPSRPGDRPCQSPRHPPLCTWRSVGVRACHHPARGRAGALGARRLATWLAR